MKPEDSGYEIGWVDVRQIGHRNAIQKLTIRALALHEKEKYFFPKALKSQFSYISAGKNDFFPIWRRGINFRNIMLLLVNVKATLRN